jgi:hypothetical protein
VQLDDRITIATPEGVAIEMVLAGLGSRFLARLLDSVIQLLIIIALALVLGVTGSSGIGIAVFVIMVFLVVFAATSCWNTQQRSRSEDGSRHPRGGSHGRARALRYGLGAQHRASPTFFRSSISLERSPSSRRSTTNTSATSPQAQS